MTYRVGIPQSADRPSDSQSQIADNFTQLNSIFGQEHVEFNATLDNGEHKKVTLNAPLGSDPGLADPKASLYTKTVSGDSELFFEKFDNAATANLVSQMTNLPIVNFVNTGTAGGNGDFIDTPFGIRIIWGLTASFSGSRTVIEPNGNNILQYQLTGNVSTGSRNPINGGTIVGDTLSIRTIDNVSVRYFIITLF